MTKDNKPLTDAFIERSGRTPLPSSLFESTLSEQEKEMRKEAARLVRAAASGDNKAVAALLEKHKGTSFVNWKNEDDSNALIAATINGRVETVKLLIAAKADVSPKYNPETAGRVWEMNNYGITPLMAAAMSGESECAAVLLAAGADPLARNKKGQTAADLAAEREYPVELITHLKQVERDTMIAKANARHQRRHPQTAPV